MRRWADGFEPVAVVSELKAVVREASPGSTMTELRQEGWTKLELTADDGADYSFSVGVYHDLEDLELIAEPTGTVDDVYFWALPLERPDFEDFPEMLETLKGYVRRVLLNPTRIRQTRGWILWTFVCEVRQEEWQPLYRHACVRGLTRVPRAKEKERVFHGPCAPPSAG